MRHTGFFGRFPRTRAPQLRNSESTIRQIDGPREIEVPTGSAPWLLRRNVNRAAV
jgi:hypothetical protein